MLQLFDQSDGCQDQASYLLEHVAEIWCGPPSSLP